MMKQEITIELTKDLEILCNIFGISPDELLQAFMDHISLPRYMNCETNALVETATAFFIFHAPTHDTCEMQKHLFQHLNTMFCDEIANEVVPGPEAEEHIRRIVLQWHEAVCNERRRMKCF